MATMQQLDLQADPFSIPMVFLRIGWMDHYRGLSGGDRIKGGGKYVDEHGYGHEIFNFQEHEGRVYGYAQPPRGAADMSTHPRINIGRLGASTKDEVVSGVVAVWIANHISAHESVIVGWYQNATVHRHFQQMPPGSGRIHNDEEMGFYISATEGDSTLLPKDARLFPVPTGGKGELGQSNIWYADDPAVHGQFRRQVLDYIANRELPTPPPGNGGGRPTQPDPLLRQKVEKAAVKKTTAHFKGIGYKVDSFEKDNVGWDLEAVRGQIKLRREVKGLSGPEHCVELTPNEYAKMQEYRQSYRICVVTNALSNPRLDVFAFSPDSQRWEDDDGRPLAIEKIIAARCRAGKI